jgi:hypothetical protein
MKFILLSVLMLNFGLKTKTQTICYQATNQMNMAAQLGIFTIENSDPLYTYQGYSGKWGIKNRSGRVVLSARYETIGKIYNSKFPVIINGYHGIADTNGKVTWLKKYQFATYDYEPTGELFIEGNSNGYIAVKNKEGKIGFINYEGVLTIPCRYSSVEPFSEGLSCVGLGDLFGFIDEKGNTIVPFYYRSAYSFHNNRASVLIGNKYGFIDTTGKVVIPARYELAWRFSDGLCVVSNNANYTDFYFIDINGNIAIKEKFEQADSFNKGKAVISKKGKCWEIDKTGKKLKYMGTDYFVGC